MNELAARNENARSAIAAAVTTVTMGAPQQASARQADAAVRRIVMTGLHARI